MNTPKDAVSTALSFKGVSNGAEFTGHYNDRNGTGLPLDCSWCATFVSDIMRISGVPYDSVLDYKGCVTGVEWFVAQGRFRSRQSGYIPKPGDIIFYEWNPQNDNTEYDDGADHTGIVEYVENGRVNTIEGNSGSNHMVDCWYYPLDYACIEGYGVPLYNAGDVPTPSATDVVYQSNNGARWLPEVKNLNDYAGNLGEPISGIYVQVPGGDIYCRVHVLAGNRWLPEVKNLEDYAGNLGEAIDAVQIRVPEGTVRYRVHNIGRSDTDWCGWVTCGAEFGSTDSDSDYAGNYGTVIDGIQIEIL